MSARLPRPCDGVAVVIPALHGAANLPGCLRAMLTAALCAPVPVTTVVVLAAADDAGAKLAGQYGPDVHFVRVDAPNTGAARAAGFVYARTLSRDDHCWYATTDADTRVDPGWLVRQLGLGADVVAGSGLGFSARAYWRVGGFRPLAFGDDLNLLSRFETAGYTVARENELSVVASVRTRGRAPHGFARYPGQRGRSAAGDCA